MNKEELKKIRTSLGMTQTQLANALGVTLQAFQAWEYGKRRISRSAELLLGMILKERERGEAASEYSALSDLGDAVSHDQHPGERLSEEQIHFILYALAKLEGQLLAHEHYVTWKHNIELKAQNALLERLAEGRLKRTSKTSSE